MIFLYYESKFKIIFFLLRGEGGGAGAEWGWGGRISALCLTKNPFFFFFFFFVGGWGSGGGCRRKVARVS